MASTSKETFKKYAELGVCNTNERAAVREMAETLQKVFRVVPVEAVGESTLVRGKERAFFL